MWNEPLTWQWITVALAVAVAFASGYTGYRVYQQQSAEAKDMHGWLTGGDSYPYLEPRAIRSADGRVVEIVYYITHAGSRYPIYDLQIRRQDLDNGPFLADGSVIPSQAWLVGTLTGNTDRSPIGDLRFKLADLERKARRLRIELPHRGGLILQDLTIYPPREGGWRTKSTPIRRAGTEAELTPPITEVVIP